MRVWLHAKMTFYLFSYPELDEKINTTLMYEDWTQGGLLCPKGNKICLPKHLQLTN